MTPNDNPSDAGRKLYAISREKRKTQNDSDRLKKYLPKYGLSWDGIDGQVSAVKTNK